MKLSDESYAALIKRNSPHPDALFPWIEVPKVKSTIVTLREDDPEYWKKVRKEELAIQSYELMTRISASLTNLYVEICNRDFLYLPVL